jgi:hypothetical protein
MIKFPEPAAVVVLTTLVCSGPGRMITPTARVRRGRLVQEAGWSSGVPLWHRGQSPAGHTWLGMVVAAWKGRPSVPVTTVLARPMASSAATATGAGIGGQERGAKHAGDHQGQERPAGQGPAHRAGLIPAEPVGKALGVGPEPVREQEQAIQIQPQVAVIPGTEIKVPPPGAAKLAHVARRGVA